MDRPASTLEVPFDPTGPVTLLAALLAAAGRSPTRTFLEDHTTHEVVRWSYLDTAVAATSLGHGLNEAGLQAGERVAVVLPNCSEAVLLWLGVGAAGGVHVAVDPELRMPGFVRSFAATRPAIIVASSDRVDDVIAALGSAGIASPVYCVPHRATPAPDRAATAPLDDLFGKVSRQALLDAAGPGSSAGAAGGEMGGVIFTSGSTGGAKAVEMSHAHLRLFATTCLAQVGLGSDDVYLISNPLCHANALVLGLYPTILAGAAAALYPRFSASLWLERVRASGATVTNLIGPMMEWICRQPATSADREHALTRVRSVPAPPGLDDEFKTRFGVADVLASYGQTEFGLPVISARGEDRPAGAAGRLLERFYEARLDPGDEAGSDGSSGEFLVRARHPETITAGYMNDRAATAAAWSEGWFRSGDLVSVDGDGWFTFRGRTKDVIRRRGKNISALDIELALERHPAVTEAAVVGLADPDAAGEELVWAAVIADAGVDTDGLFGWLDQLLPRHARPEAIEVVAEFPRTAAGKIDKAALRATIGASAGSVR